MTRRREKLSLFFSRTRDLDVRLCSTAARFQRLRITPAGSLANFLKMAAQHGGQNVLV